MELEIWSHILDIEQKCKALPAISLGSTKQFIRIKIVPKRIFYIEELLSIEMKYHGYAQFILNLKEAKSNMLQLKAIGGC